MNLNQFKTVAVIVAHPDDEILWAGGTILSNQDWNVFVVSLCRASDINRAPKFLEALKVIGARGTMGDLDDSAAQEALNEEEVEQAIIDLLPVMPYDLIITHHPKGEYTRHLRHEETGRAVMTLWKEGSISAGELWCFAYEDGGREYFPKGIEKADIVIPLDTSTWERKYKLITETYDFDENSWEANSTPTTECFFKFTNPEDAMQWLGNHLEL